MNNLTIGQKIKFYRERSKKSQMDLEVEIGASTGSISRMENGVVNPTKETILKIIEVLNLNVYEATSLFGIKLDPNMFLNIANKLYSQDNLYDLILETADELVKEFNLLGVVGLIAEKEGLISITHQRSRKGKAIDKIIGRPFGSLVFKLEYINNYVVRCYLDKKKYLSHDVFEIFSPVFSKQQTIELLKIINFKSGLCLPMLVNNNCVGVMFFAKDYIDDFDIESELFQSFSNWVGILVSLLKKINITHK